MSPPPFHDEYVEVEIVSVVPPLALLEEKPGRHPFRRSFTLPLAGFV